MKMNESGVDSGYVGRFFLFAIPLVLGLAASVWLGVWIAGHDFSRKLTWDERAAQSVKADLKAISKQPLVLEVEQKTCLHVTRVETDGDRISVYLRNDCHHPLRYAELHWQLIAPDGTLISDDWTNYKLVLPGPGEQSEFIGRMNEDDRAVRLRVFTASAHVE